MAGNTHDHTACSCLPTSASVHQTLDEMEWERGIWYAGNDHTLYFNNNNK